MNVKHSSMPVLVDNFSYSNGKKVKQFSSVLFCGLILPPNNRINTHRESKAGLWEGRESV